MGGKTIIILLFIRLPNDRANVKYVSPVYEPLFENQFSLQNRITIVI